MKRLMVRLFLGVFLFLSALSPLVAGIPLGGTAHAAASSPVCTPQITSINKFAATQYQTVGIFGNCFGSATPYNGDDVYIHISVYADSSPQWNACYINDWVTCHITYWGNNEIVFAGFTGAYGKYGWTLNNQNILLVSIGNPQQGTGYYASCYVDVGTGKPTNCL